jgi:secreted effector protein SseB
VPQSPNHGKKTIEPDPYTGQMNVLFELMALTMRMSDQLVKDTTKLKDAGNDAQDNANYLDDFINRLINGEGVTDDRIDPGGPKRLQLPMEIFLFFKDNNIQIDGQNVVDWVRENFNGGSPYLDQGQFMKFKTAASNYARRASDFVTQANLDIQRMLGYFNTQATMAMNLQSGQTDLNKGVANKFAG